MSDNIESNSGGSGTSGIADAKRPECDLHGRKHRLTSSDVNNDSSALLGLGSALDEPQVMMRRLKKKIKVIQPMSKELESELNAKGESTGAGSGNGQQLGSSSEEGSADPAQSRKSPDGERVQGALRDVLPSEPDTKNQACEDQEKGPALGQVQNSLHAIYSWYNSSRNAYLEQAKSYIEVIERQNAARSLVAGKASNSDEIDAVQRAVEVSIQIMRASAEVEARQRKEWNNPAPADVPTARP